MRDFYLEANKLYHSIPFYDNTETFSESHFAKCQMAILYLQYLPEADCTNEVWQLKARCNFWLANWYDTQVINKQLAFAHHQECWNAVQAIVNKDSEDFNMNWVSAARMLAIFLDDNYLLQENQLPPGDEALEAQRYLLVWLDAFLHVEMTAENWDLFSEETEEFFNSFAFTSLPSLIYGSLGYVFTENFELNAFIEGTKELYDHIVQCSQQSDVGLSIQIYNSLSNILELGMENGHCQNRWLVQQNTDLLSALIARKQEYKDLQVADRARASERDENLWNANRLFQPLTFVETTSEEVHANKRQKIFK